MCRRCQALLERGGSLAHQLDPSESGLGSNREIGQQSRPQRGQCRHDGARKVGKRREGVVIARDERCFPVSKMCESTEPIVFQLEKAHQDDGRALGHSAASWGECREAQASRKLGETKAKPLPLTAGNRSTAIGLRYRIHSKGNLETQIGVYVRVTPRYYPSKRKAFLEGS
jgi:hypothetical protein